MLLFWCVENGHTGIYVGKYGKEFSFRCVCRDRVPAKALLLWEGGAENGHTGICVEKYGKAFSFWCVCRDRVPAKALLLWEGGAATKHIKNARAEHGHFDNSEVRCDDVEQATRIELATSAWEADVLPLNYACIFYSLSRRSRCVKI